MDGPSSKPEVYKKNPDHKRSAREGSSPSGFSNQSTTLSPTVFETLPLGGSTSSLEVSKALLDLEEDRLGEEAGEADPL